MVVGSRRDEVEQSPDRPDVKLAWMVTTPPGQAQDPTAGREKTAERMLLLPTASRKRAFAFKIYESKFGGQDFS